MDDKTQEEVMRLLAEPVPEIDLKWRIGKINDAKTSAKVFVYVTSRKVYSLLDEVVGCGNWQNKMPVAGPCGGLMQGLSIRIDGEWVTKWDGADVTPVEGVKGTFSASIKRAAVLWGIGRYLYAMPKSKVKLTSNGDHYACKNGKVFLRWDQPKMPAWALPGGSGSPDRTAKPSAKTTSQKSGQTMSETLNGFIDEMDNCTVAEMRAISQRIKDSGLEGDNLQILRDAKQTRLAQIDIDADNGPPEDEYPNPHKQ